MTDPVMINVEVDAQRRVHAFVVVAKVRGRHRARIRLWAACQLLGIASAVMGSGLEIDLKLDTEPHG